MPSVWSRALARSLAALTASAVVLAGALAAVPAAAAGPVVGEIAGTVTNDHGQPLTPISAAPASAAATASISGTVTDAAGDPVHFVRVSTYRIYSDTYSGPTAHAFSWTDGAYTITGLTPGTYAVQFTPFHRDSEVHGEWWSDKPDVWTSDVITVSEGSATSGIDATLEIGIQVDGFISSALDAAGVAGATVAVVYEDGREFTTTTDAGGYYKLLDLPPGRHTFLVTPPIASGLAPQWYGGAVDRAGALWITSKDGSWLCCMNFELSPPVLSSSEPSVTGAVAVGSTLVASAGEWQPGAGLTYRWLADGIAIEGATEESLLLTSALRDRSISVEVTGTLDGFTEAVRTSPATGKVATAATPTVTGSAAVGVKLTASPNTWTSGTVFTYRWLADGVPIDGAISSAFTPGTAQDGQAISVEVTGKKSGWATVTKTSKSTLKVMRAATPKVTGTIAYGATLKLDPGIWSEEAELKQQWYADGRAISGATSTSLKLTSGLKGKRISVKVTGTNTGYTTVSKTSASTGKVATTSAPGISGTRAVGSTLTVTRGTWTTGTTFSYQWYADGKTISGATRSTYRLSSGAESKRITVTVTGRKSGYATVTRTSSATSRIMRASTPTISGTRMVGSTLRVDRGTWTGGTTPKYQWYVNGVAASGATGSTFYLSKARAGKTIKVRVTGSNPGYATIARVSGSTSTVKSGKAAPATRDNCPSGYKIKGNQTTRHTTDWIYHVPGGAYYSVTDPEECFATEAAARAWGYRESYR